MSEKDNLDLSKINNRITVERYALTSHIMIVEERLKRLKNDFERTLAVVEGLVSEFGNLTRTNHRLRRIEEHLGFEDKAKNRAVFKIVSYPGKKENKGAFAAPTGQEGGKGSHEGEAGLVKKQILKKNLTKTGVAVN